MQIVGLLRAADEAVDDGLPRVVLVEQPVVADAGNLRMRLDPLPRGLQGGVELIEELVRLGEGGLAVGRRAPATGAGRR
jgi:hypothetical protein